MKKIFFLIFFLLVFPTHLFAYVSPGKPTGLVNDFAKVLTADERDTLAQTLVGFGQSTGNAIVIATLPDLGGDSIENVAEKLFQEWGIGDGKKDNGLLIVVARDDHRVRIEVGYGLEPIVTDALSSQVINQVMIPAFREGKYFEGLSGGVDALTHVISQDPEYVVPGESGASKDGKWSGNLFGFIIFGIIWLGSIFARSKSWWAGGVVGAVIGAIFGFIYGFLFTGIIAIIVLSVVGLIFDFIVSKAHANSRDHGTRPPWWLGGMWGGFGGSGGFGGGSGGGFGGFGGGGSGGGGSSGSW